jgi:hypothetical protein
MMTPMKEGSSQRLEARYARSEKVPGLRVFRDVSDPDKYVDDGDGVVVPVSTPTGGIRGSKDPSGRIEPGSVWGLKGGRMVPVGSTDALIDELRRSRRVERKVVEASRTEEDVAEEAATMDKLLDDLERTVEREAVEAYKPSDDDDDIPEEPVPTRTQAKAPAPSFRRVAEPVATGYIVSSERIGSYEGVCRELVVDEATRMLVLVHDLDSRVYTPPASPKDILELKGPDGKARKCVYVGVAFALPASGVRVQVFHMAE